MERNDSMKWEKCTFGELKADEVYAFSDPTTDTFTSMDFLCWVRGSKAGRRPNTPVYRLIPDAPVVDAKWVEKAMVAVCEYVGIQQCCETARRDVAAIISRHAPAQGVDVKPFTDLERKKYDTCKWFFECIRDNAIRYEEGDYKDAESLYLIAKHGSDEALQSLTDHTSTPAIDLKAIREKVVEKLEAIINDEMFVTPRTRSMARAALALLQAEKELSK